MSAIGQPGPWDIPSQDRKQDGILSTESDSLIPAVGIVVELVLA